MHDAEHRGRDVHDTYAPAQRGKRRPQQRILLVNESQGDSGDRAEQQAMIMAPITTAGLFENSP